MRIRNVQVEQGTAKSVGWSCDVELDSLRPDRLDRTCEIAPRKIERATLPYLGPINPALLPL